MKLMLKLKLSPLIINVIDFYNKFR